MLYLAECCYAFEKDKVMMTILPMTYSMIFAVSMRASFFEKTKGFKEMMITAQ
ncbi:unnamed protein product [marine sediment metagenome]|uniref:Uncharacterized protein n=1 Tax=marine sediment metagenome TaxID=412755 RepID=X0SU95_9ZZZZ